MNNMPDMNEHERHVFWVFDKLLHVMGGIAIWEIFAYLDFDWLLASGRKRRPWTFWIYLGCRTTALAAIIVGLAGFNLDSKTDTCHGWTWIAILALDFAFAFAMFMVVIRIAAIWDKNAFVLLAAMSAWCTPLVIYLRNLIESNMDQGAFAGCSISKEHAWQTSVCTMVTSLVLLLIMLLGLWRIRRANLFAMWRLLHRQGLVWLCFVLVAEVPVFVVIALMDIGTPAYMFLQVPRVLITTLGATRMYRSLYNFRLDRQEYNSSSLRRQRAQPFRIHSAPEDPLYAPDPEDMHRAARQAQPLEIEVHVMSECVPDPTASASTITESTTLESMSLPTVSPFL